MKVLKKHRTKIKFIAYAVFLMMSGLIGRMTYVVVFRGEELTVKATELHERERAIKAGRGRIISSDGTVLATNETVCTVSVIHSQIKDPERVISILSEELDMDEEKVRKYVEKFSSMEKIKSNVPKETGDAIRSYELAGVKVDEDSKRIYPYSELASKVLGFTGYRLLIYYSTDLRDSTIGIFFNLLYIVKLTIIPNTMVIANDIMYEYQKIIFGKITSSISTTVII